MCEECQSAVAAMTAERDVLKWAVKRLCNASGLSAPHEGLARFRDEIEDRATNNVLHIPTHLAQLAAANERADKADAECAVWRREADAAAHAGLRAQERAEKAEGALGRVTALLPDALLWIEAESIALKDATPYEECIAKVKAAMADPEGRAAGEMLAALEAEHEAWDRYNNDEDEDRAKTYDDMIIAHAAVEALRGDK